MSWSFLDELYSAAEAAAALENEFRREAAERIAALECERAFAFRRLNLMRAVVDAQRDAESEEQAVAQAQDVLRARLDWPNESETQSTLLSRFAPVAQAVFASLRPGTDGADNGIVNALAEFENWYGAEHRASFWTLFEQPMAETPRVDF